MATPSSQLAQRLNNRRFAVASNTHGLSGSGTVFHYQIEGDVISGTYQGGGGFGPGSRSAVLQGPTPLSCFTSA